MRLFVCLFCYRFGRLHREHLRPVHDLCVHARGFRVCVLLPLVHRWGVFLATGGGLLGIAGIGMMTGWNRRLRVILSGMKGRPRDFWYCQ